MKILFINSDLPHSESIVSDFTALGHEVLVCSDVVQAAENLGKEHCPLVLIAANDGDDISAHVMMLRRSSQDYMYVAVLAEGLSQSDAVRMGANEALSAGPSQDDLKTIMGDVQRLYTLIEQIGDEGEDFPSGGGVIARSAFYQLFLSGIDRAGRYGEETYVLFMSLDNYDDLYALGGPYVADYTGAALSKKISDMRRQSDILGQIGHSAYGLLLQRPSHRSEPLDAAKRFSEALSQAIELSADSPAPVKVRVELVALPSGSLRYSNVITL